MDFWNSLLTEKSWQKLQELKKKEFNFILIGGWAAFLWTSQHKSKDINIVLTEYKDLDFLKNNYDLKKNDELKKYEIVFGEIDLDIYVPYFSKLAIPPEDIAKHIANIEGFSTVKPEVLLILKQGAEIERTHSAKGEKDRIDIMSLVCFCEIDFKEYLAIIHKYKLERFYAKLIEIVKNFQDFKYLNMTPAQLRKKKQEIMKKISLGK